MLNEISKVLLKSNVLIGRVGFPFLEGIASSLRLTSLKIYVGAAPTGDSLSMSFTSLMNVVRNKLKIVTPLLSIVESMPTVDLALHLNDNFAKMRASLKICEGISTILKTKDTINDRMDLMLLIKSEHFFKAILWPIDDALESDGTRQRKDIDVGPVVSIILFPRNIANACNHSTVSDRVERLSDSLGTTSLEDDVGSVIV